jgi:hypothetical protein
MIELNNCDNKDWTRELHLPNYLPTESSLLEHKLTDTGEYLVSEVEGEPTCLFSYGFYDIISHPRVKECYDNRIKLYGGASGGGKSYPLQNPEEALTYSEASPRIEPSNLIMNLIRRI